MKQLTLKAFCLLLLICVAAEIQAQSVVTVGPGVWVSTGITLVKGQRFKVVATGILKYTEYPFTEIGPNGNGYYSLKGLIKDPSGANDQFMVLGASGGDTARFDGELKLAATGSIYYNNGNPTYREDNGLKGSFAVTVYLEKIASLPKVVTKGPVALLKLTGDANYLKPGEDFKEAFEGMRLGPDDEIHTGPDSDATLLFPDGSTVELRQTTRIRVRGLLSSENRVKIELLLKMGELKSHVIRQDPVGADFSVKSPTATASVRGTAFTVRYNEATQTTTVSVQEHSVLITPANTSVKPFVLDTNQQVDVTQYSASAIKPISGRKEAIDDISLGPKPPAMPKSGCGWQDAPDPKAPGDEGRGITNWQAHFQYANGGGGANVPGFIGNRMAILRNCLSREAYAQLYALVSVRIGVTGRAQAGWLDAVDNRAGNDPGRGISDARQHAGYVIAGEGVAPAHKFVTARLTGLRSQIPVESYARLYADLSVLIANFGNTGKAPG